MTDHFTSSAPPTDPLDFALLAQYWAGETSAAENLMIEAWLASAPGRKEWHEALRCELGDDGWTGTSSADLERLTRHVMHRVGEQAAHSQTISLEPTSRPLRSRFSLPRRRVSFGRIFGGAAVACLVALGIWRGTTKHAESSFLESYTTRSGHDTTIVLTDGSTVRLAPHTTLSVAEGFGQSHRRVTLVGEGFFTVASSAGTPFIVQSGRVATQVLGTEFSVRHDSVEHSVQVAVQSGKVRASGLASAIMLAGGDIAVITDSVASLTNIRELRQYTDWNRGTLVFTRTPVVELLAVLSRWYGYRFELADSVLAAKQVSVSVKMADSSDMFTVLKEILGVSLTISDTVVTLHPRPQGHTSPQSAPWEQPVRTNAFQPVLENNQ